MKPERVKTPHGEMLMFPHVLQGSEQWYEMRAGRVTASSFSKIFTPAKMAVSAQATGYIHKLIADTIDTDITGCNPPPTYWQQRGNDLEPIAREAFRKATGKQVVEVGFCVRADEWEILGASPDALIVDPVTLEYIEGLEIKCLKPENHVAIIDAGEMPTDHVPQVKGSLAVTGLAAWNFMSFCPGMPPFIQRIERDESVTRITAALDQFLIEYANARARLVPMLRLEQP